MRSISTVLVVLFLSLFLFTADAFAVPFWGAKTSMPAGTDPATLKPGEFVWDPAASPSGPMVVAVSLEEQRAYVYRNGIRIGVTTVSTGRKGHRTPTGVFTILQKDKDHHSSIYHNAAMPYTERLTWGGVALHAGGLPGYPSSHGCVHLPSAFAKDLFQVSSKGMTVVIADKTSGPGKVLHPGALAPVDAASGEEEEETALSTSEAFSWNPEKASEGPVSMIISSADKRILVYRNGIEIGRSRLTIDNPEEGLGTHAFVYVPGKGKSDFHWMAIGIPGHAGEDNKALDPKEAERVHLPSKFRDAVRQLLHPGISLVVTDAPVLESSTGVKMNVVSSNPPGHESPQS